MTHSVARESEVGEISSVELFTVVPLSHLTMVTGDSTWRTLVYESLVKPKTDSHFGRFKCSLILGFELITPGPSNRIYCFTPLPHLLHVMHLSDYNIFIFHTTSHPSLRGILAWNLHFRHNPNCLWDTIMMLKSCWEQDLNPCRWNRSPVCQPLHQMAPTKITSE